VNDPTTIPAEGTKNAPSQPAGLPEQISAASNDLHSIGNQLRLAAHAASSLIWNGFDAEEIEELLPGVSDSLENLSTQLSKVEQRLGELSGDARKAAPSRGRGQP
jgi:hypothetical protein